MPKIIERYATPENPGKFSANYRRRLILLIADGWDDADIPSIKDLRVIKRLYDTGTYDASNKKIDRRFKAEFKRLVAEYAAAETQEQREMREYFSTSAGQAEAEMAWRKSQGYATRVNYCADRVLEYIKSNDVNRHADMVNLLEDFKVAPKSLAGHFKEMRLREFNLRDVKKFCDIFRDVLTPMFIRDFIRGVEEKAWEFSA